METSFIGGNHEAPFSVLALTLALSSPTLAQQQQCGPRSDLVKALGDRYSEAPIAAGMVDNKTIIEVFARADGESWTIVTSRADGNSCIMFAGKVWIKVPYKQTGPRT